MYSTVLGDTVVASIASCAPWNTTSIFLSSILLGGIRSRSATQTLTETLPGGGHERQGNGHKGGDTKDEEARLDHHK